MITQTQTTTQTGDHWLDKIDAKTQRRELARAVVAAAKKAGSLADVPAKTREAVNVLMSDGTYNADAMADAVGTAEAYLGYLSM